MTNVFYHGIMLVRVSNIGHCRFRELVKHAAKDGKETCGALYIGIYPTLIQVSYIFSIDERPSNPIHKNEL